MQQVIDKAVKSAPAPSCRPTAGEYVLASYVTKAPSKQSARWQGPYVVVREDLAHIDSFLCQDLNSQECYSFHLTRLRPFHVRHRITPRDVAAQNKAVFVVDRVIEVDFPGKKWNTNAWRMLVRWEGYGPSADSWITFIDGTNRHLSALDDFLHEHPELALRVGSVVALARAKAPLYDA
jgi:hypothetical protein